MKVYIYTLIAICSMLYLLSCDSGGSDSQPGSDKNISRFYFSTESNTSLTADVEGEITGTTITCYIPFTLSRTALKASFETDGEEIRVNEVLQESGTSIIDFSDEVIYSVKAADGSVQSYSVNVINRFHDGFTGSGTTITGWGKTLQGNDPQSEAYLESDTLILKGGYDSNNPDYGALMGQAHVHKAINFSDSFRIIVCNNQVSDSRLVITLWASDSTYYQVGLLNSTVVITRDAANITTGTVPSFNATHDYEIAVTRSSSSIQVIITDLDTDSTYTLNATDSTYTSFTGITLTGGYYSSSALITTVDDIIIDLL